MLLVLLSSVLLAVDGGRTVARGVPRDTATTVAAEPAGRAVPTVAEQKVETVEAILQELFPAPATPVNLQDIQRQVAHGQAMLSALEAYKHALQEIQAVQRAQQELADLQTKIATLKREITGLGGDHTNAFARLEAAALASSAPETAPARR